jgi:hypothetical protein
MSVTNRERMPVVSVDTRRSVGRTYRPVRTETGLVSAPQDKQSREEGTDGYACFVVRVKFGSGKLRRLWEYQLRKARESDCFVDARPAERLGESDHVSVWEVWGNPAAIVRLFESPAVVRVPSAGGCGLFKPREDGTVPDAEPTQYARREHGVGSLRRTDDHAPVVGKARETVRYGNAGRNGRAVLELTDRSLDARRALAAGETFDVRVPAVVVDGIQASAIARVDSPRD